MLSRFTGAGLSFRPSCNHTGCPKGFVLGDCQVGRWVQPSGQREHLSASFLVHPVPTKRFKGIGFAGCAFVRPSFVVRPLRASVWGSNRPTPRSHRVVQKILPRHRFYAPSFVLVEWVGVRRVVLCSSNGGIILKPGRQDHCSRRVHRNRAAAGAGVDAA